MGNISERVVRLSKEISWILLGQLAAVAGSLFGIRIITEMLPPAVYGELALGMTIALLVNQLVFGPLTNGIARFYSVASERGGIPGYLGTVRTLVLSSTMLVVAAALILLIGAFLLGKIQSISLMAGVVVFAILTGFNSIFSAVQNAARQRAVVSLHQAMDTWTKFAAAAVLVFLLGATSYNVLLGYSLSLVIVLTSQLYFFRNIGLNDLRSAGAVSEWRGKILSYSWPFMAWGGFSWLQGASDRWALQFFLTPHDVGLYAVLFQLGYYPASMISGMAMQLLAPIFYQRVGDGTDSNRNASVTQLSWHLTVSALGMTACASLAAYFFHAEIFRLFVSNKYSGVSHLLPWMLLAGGVFAAAQTIALNLMSQMKTRDMTICKMVTSVLGVVFNFAGAYYWGIPGLVYASLFFSAFYMGWIYLLAIRLLPDHKVGMALGAV